MGWGCAMVISRRCSWGGWLGHVASCSPSYLVVAAGGQGVWETPRGAGGGVRVRAGLPLRRRAGAYFLVGTVGIKLEVG